MSDAIGILLGPGLVFLALAAWLVRKAVQAARTERDLEQERLARALGRERDALQRKDPFLAAVPAEVSRPLPAPKTPPPLPLPPLGEALRRADVAAAAGDHLRALDELLGKREELAPGSAQVLWVRSAGAHIAWCERPPGARGSERDILCVARVVGTRIDKRWSYGGP